MTLDELRRLEEQASEGPWLVQETKRKHVGGIVSVAASTQASTDILNQGYSDVPDLGAIVETDGGVYPPRSDDAAFIVAARNHFAALLAVAEAAGPLAELADRMADKLTYDALDAPCRQISAMRELLAQLDAGK